MKAPVAITGLGCIGAPGRGLAAQRAALSAGTCHLSRITDPNLPLAATLMVGRVGELLPTTPGRTAGLALAAAQDALRSAGLSPNQCARIGVVVGTCTGGLPESEIAFARDRETPWPIYRQQQPHRLSQVLAHMLQLGGPRSTHSVACASAACAIAEAVEWIRQGIAPAVLAIGADALTRVTMAGFHSLMLVDPDGCRPLTHERHGMSLGEGAGALLLEDADHARRRGARPIASLLGWGLRADAFHSTRPDPSGTHLLATIDEALTDGGLDARDVGYLSAHGTGTLDNDSNEIAVLARRFPSVPTASSKRIYGHTLGAAAAIEAVASCLALADDRLWANAGVEGGTPLDGVDVVTRTRTGRLDAICSTTLAFGGSNAALVFGRGERCA